MASPPEGAPPRPVLAALIAWPWWLARVLGAVAALLIAAIVLHAAAGMLGDRLGLRVALVEKGGVITVESPEVYTRERLLNDRLDHAAWLETLLAAMSEKDFDARFQSIDLWREEVLSRSLGATPDAAPPRTTPERAGTTLDRFEAMNEYRDTLRAERLQLLLDDRHDREGNTLYLLSVDTTVLRARDERRLGLVMFRLASPGDLGPAGPNGTGDFAAREFRDVLREWRAHVQDTLDSAVKAQEAAIAHILPHRDAVTLERLLAVRVCEAILDDRAVCDAVATLYGEPPPGSTGGAAEEHAPLAFHLNAWWGRAVDTAWWGMTEQIRRNLDAKRSEARAALAAWGITAEPRAAGPNAQQDWKEALFEACALRPSHPYAPVTERELTEIETRLREPAAGEGARAAGLRPPALSCPPTRAQLAIMVAEALVAGIDEARRKTIEGLLRQQHAAGPATWREVSDRLGKEIADCLVVAAPPGPEQEGPGRCAAAPVLSTRRDQHDWANACGAARLQKARFERDLAETARLDLEGAGSAPLRDALALQVITLNTDPWCRLVLLPVVPEADKATAALWRALNRDVDLFAYAMAPRRQERTSLSDIAAESISASPGGALAELLGGLGFGEARRSLREGRAGRALVAGFGTPHRHRAPDAAAPNQAVFGWFLGARSASGNDVPTPEQHRLQATVSVPSWWRTVALETVTCWVAPADLSRAIEEATEADAGERLWSAITEPGGACTPRPGTVYLPGNVEEISSRLGIEIHKRPHIESVRPAQALSAPREQLMVGMPARLVIQGGRLWRNTLVAIGAQTADRIRVLPNMRGIIAEFHCLTPPLLWRRPNIAERVSPDQEPEAGDVMVPVRLWTSEGRDEFPGGVLVRAFRADPAGGLAEPCHARPAR